MTIQTDNFACTRRKTPANIRMRKRGQHAKTLQYKSTIAERERLYDNAVESNPPVSATPIPSSPLLPFPSQDPQDPPPQDPPPSRAVRRLALESMEMQQAIDSLPARLPSRELAGAANIADEEAPLPASPVIYCSQYRMEEYERENGPLPGNEMVGEWLHNVETAYSPAASSQGNGLNPTLPAAPPKDKYVTDSESPSASQPPVRYPTPPAAPPKDDYIPESDSECSNNYGQPRKRRRPAPPAYIFRDGQLMFHKMYQGRQPFTFVDTGLYQGGRHDWNGVHNERDLVWAHRLDRVLKHHNILRRTATAPKQDAGSL